MDKKFLAVDTGASGGKCFTGFFDADGAFRMEETYRFDHDSVRFFLADRHGALQDRLYWDDTLIYHHIIKSLQHYRRDIGATLDGIGIATWGADAGFLTADNEMAGKMYCYRDRRLDDMIGEVKACMPPEELYAITGIHFQPFNLSNQLRWWVTRRHELMREVNLVLPTAALFYHYLGGSRQVDSTWASVTQLMDARTRDWSEEILVALNIPRHILPEIVEPGARIGTLHEPLRDLLGLCGETGLYAVGSHDTASAFAAAPVADPDTALIISSGTWSLVGKLLPQPLTTAAAMAANISNEGGIGDTRFLKNCMGTWIVQELLKQWEIRDGVRMPWREVDTITPAATPFTAFINPDDPRFYNPSDMEGAIIEFLRERNQPLPKDRGTILRIVYESLAMQYRLVNEQLCAISGRPSTVVHIVGGGSGNLLLNQFTADATGLPVIAGPKEATAVGNLMLQAIGAGVYPGLPTAQRSCAAAFPLRRFEPENTTPWNQAYRAFNTATQ